MTFGLLPPLLVSVEARNGGVVPVVGYGGKYDLRTTVLFTVLLPSPCRKEDVRTVSFSLAPPPLVRRLLAHAALGLPQ